MDRMQELRALGELLGMLATSPRTGPLLALLALATVIDWRTLRIPNWLTGGGVLYALGLALLHTGPTAGGIGTAIGGLVVGLVLLLPLYLLRATGAGDVKLLAMVGAFLGPASVMGAAVYSLAVGGLLALGLASARGSLRQLPGNLRVLAYAVVLRGSADAARRHATAGKAPYAAAFLVGTTAWLVQHPPIVP